IFTDSAKPATNGRIIDCFFSGSDSTTGLNSGVKLDTGSSQWLIRGSIFERLIGVVSGTGYGVLLGASERNHIIANHFVGTRGQGRHAVYLSGGASSNTVSDNVVTGFNESSIAVYARSYQPGCLFNQLLRNRIASQQVGSNGSAAIEVAGNASWNWI